ncbi:MAG: preprotein translocase subunit SecG [Clostridia bacterium]|nr:preprotein translocase subunit SecG [Clostridia bacterium]
MELFLMIVLLISAVFIVFAVIMQDSNEGGLSGTISGKSDTYYGKDKSTHKNRMLFKLTLICAVVFALAVFFVYAMQPDVTNAVASPEEWLSYSEYKDIL